jgi:hypothetical protein
MPFFCTDRDRDIDRDRERDSLFRIRERTRWLDSALREEGSLSRIDPDRTDGLIASEGKKSSPANPISFGEDIQYWTDRVCGILFHFCIYLLLQRAKVIHTLRLYQFEMVCS